MVFMDCLGCLFLQEVEVERRRKDAETRDEVHMLEHTCNVKL